MISSKLKQKLSLIRSSNKIPGVLLITGLYDSEKKTSLLKSAAQELEGSEISEAKGGLIYLEPEDSSSIKVGDVRDLLKKISLRNWAEGKKRYILIPFAESLTVQSSNALLKSLEDSPENTHFILGAPSKRSVLKTIQSRSFILNEEVCDDVSKKESENAFSLAFFSKDFDLLSKTPRTDLKNELQDFSFKLRDSFVDNAYSGDLDRKEWHRLFDFIEELDQKIEANMETKWVVAKIERFSFNG